MDISIRRYFEDLGITDKAARYQSFEKLLALTDQPVEWTYEVWDELTALLETGDNHQRSMAAQLLSNLAKSDPEERLLHDFDRLLNVTRDEKFVTARHSLQSLWKVGVVNNKYCGLVENGLSQRFRECVTEKNSTLIRYDILEVFRKIFDRLPGPSIQQTAIDLIETETDEKYRKKYRGLWKGI